MAEIIICEFMDEAAVDSLRRDHEVVYDPTLVERTEALTAAVADASALIVRNRTQVRGALLDAAEQLRVVGRLGVGLDNIDVDACRQRGIEVCPATGANDLAVTEYVIAATLCLFRGAYHASQAMLDGRWPRAALMGRETAGKRLGLVGFGGIARHTARHGAALGMEIGAYDPYVGDDDPAWSEARRMDFELLLPWADALSLHVPLTDATRHLIDRRALERMKPGAILINAARGGIVDEDALAVALRSGHLGGAALDVFETEPLSREAAEKFDGLENLILTPHIAGVTEESNQRVSAVTADQVRRVLAERV